MSDDYAALRERAAHVARHAYDDAHAAARDHDAALGAALNAYADVLTAGGALAAPRGLPSPVEAASWLLSLAPPATRGRYGGDPGRLLTSEGDVLYVAAAAKRDNPDPDTSTAIDAARRMLLDHVRSTTPPLQ